MAKKLFIGYKSPKIYLGGNAVKAVYLGSEKLYPSASVVITNVTTATVIPAGGGRVTFNCTVYYTYDGQARTKAYSFSRTYASLGESITSSNTKIDSVTLYMDDSEIPNCLSGDSSFTLDLYQQKNELVSAVWSSANAGSISGVSMSVSDTSATVSNLSAADTSRTLTLTYTSGVYTYTVARTAYTWACDNTSFAFTTSNSESLSFSTKGNQHNDSVKSATVTRTALWVHGTHTGTASATATLTQAADSLYGGTPYSVGTGYDYKDESFSISYGKISASGAAAALSKSNAYKYRTRTSYRTVYCWVSDNKYSHYSDSWGDWGAWSSNKTASESFSISGTSNSASLNSDNSVSAASLGTSVTAETKRGTVTCVFTLEGGSTRTKTADVYQQANAVTNSDYQGYNDGWYINAVSASQNGINAGGGSVVLSAAAGHTRYYKYLYTSGSSTDWKSTAKTDDIFLELSTHQGTWSVSGSTVTHGSMGTTTGTDSARILVYNATLGSHGTIYRTWDSGNITNSYSESYINKNVKVSISLVGTLTAGGSVAVETSLKYDSYYIRTYTSGHTSGSYSFYKSYEYSNLHDDVIELSNSTYFTYSNGDTCGYLRHSHSSDESYTDSCRLTLSPGVYDYDKGTYPSAYVDTTVTYTKPVVTYVSYAVNAQNMWSDIDDIPYFNGIQGYNVFASVSNASSTSGTTSILFTLSEKASMEIRVGIYGDAGDDYIQIEEGNDKDRVTTVISNIHDLSEYATKTISGRFGSFVVRYNKTNSPKWNHAVIAISTKHNCTEVTNTTSF